MKHAKAILILLFVSVTAFPQQRKIKQEIEQKGILLTEEWSIGARLYSHGWGIFGERAKILNIYKTRLFQFGFAELRHFKQKKQSAEFTFLGSNLESPKDFYYGKKNHFFMLRVGFGYKKIIAEKAEKSGVRLSMIYLGGLSLGFLKPYYLDLAYPVDDGNTNDNRQTYLIVSQKYSEENAEKFLDWYSISGASGFKYGLREIEPVPGVYGKFGLNFDWASNDEFVKALEAGIIADVYYKKIPLMVNQKDKFYFLAVYISFQFGKRW